MLSNMLRRHAAVKRNDARLEIASGERCVLHDSGLRKVIHTCPYSGTEHVGAQVDSSAARVAMRCCIDDYKAFA